MDVSLARGFGHFLALVLGFLLNCGPFASVLVQLLLGFSILLRPPVQFPIPISTPPPTRHCWAQPWARLSHACPGYLTPPDPASMSLP